MITGKLDDSSMTSVAGHFTRDWRFTPAFDINARSARGECAQLDKEIGGTPAWAAVDERVQAVLAPVPTDVQQALDWLLAQDTADLLSLLHMYDNGRLHLFAPACDEPDA